MTLHIIIGILCAAFLVGLSKKIYPRKIKRVWRDGLIIAALVYVGFALFAQNWEWLLIEIGGVLLYGTFAFLAKRFSVLFIGIGWGLHVLWDIFLHPNGHPGFVPEWYPGVCLGFDLVIASYFIWYFFNQKNQKFQPQT